MKPKNSCLVFLFFLFFSFLSNSFSAVIIFLRRAGAKQTPERRSRFLIITTSKGEVLRVLYIYVHARKRGINVSIMSILLPLHHTSTDVIHPWEMLDFFSRSFRMAKVQSSQKMWVYSATPTNQLTQFRIKSDTLHIVVSLAIWVYSKWATWINHRPA